MNFWQVKNITPTKGEILIYGDIEDFQWVEEDVTAIKFANDLKNLGNVSEIDLRINSGGGSVFAAQAIYSQLKTHTAKISVYIDGLAASAASLIAMAGDVIKIPVNAMIMIHNPLIVARGEKKDLEKTIEMLDKVKDTILATYEVKTGLSREELSKMMDEETWMTGSEAVEKGFADELLNSISVAASLKGNKLVMNSITHDISSYQKKPNIPEVQFPENSTFKEDEDLKNLEDLKNKYPELYAQARQDGINAENSRIKAIEDLGVKNYDLVQKAKYESMLSPQDLAMASIQAEKNMMANYLEARREDASVLGSIGASYPPESAYISAEEQSQQTSNKLSNFMNKIRGGVK